MATRYAYLAGIIDGEGCLHARVSKRGRLVLRLTVATTSEPLRDWLSDNFGGSAYARPRRESESHRRPCWTWEARIRSTPDLLREAMPFLVVKRRQAELFLELVADREGHQAHIPAERQEHRLRLIGDLRDAKRVA